MSLKELWLNFYIGEYFEFTAFEGPMGVLNYKAVFCLDFCARYFQFPWKNTVAVQKRAYWANLKLVFELSKASFFLVVPRTIHPFPRCPKPARGNRLPRDAIFNWCVFRRRRRAQLIYKKEICSPECKNPFSFPEGIEHFFVFFLTILWSLWSIVLLSSHESSSSRECEFQPLENFRVRVIHAWVRVRNRVKTFKVNLQNILSKLKTYTNYMYFFIKNWTLVESSLCFSNSRFLEFAVEMLGASSSESRDFRVLQSTSQDRVRVATR